MQLCNANDIYALLGKSKGAAHIMTLQLARELTKKACFNSFWYSTKQIKRNLEWSDAIDDQVIKTRGWTKEYAQQYQLNGLLTGEETPPQRLAEFVAFLLQSKEHHKYLTVVFYHMEHDMEI